MQNKNEWPSAISACKVELQHLAEQELLKYRYDPFAKPLPETAISGREREEAAVRVMWLATTGPAK